MDQLICASLSHTHYWYDDVGMLEVPAIVLRTNLSPLLYNIECPASCLYPPLFIIIRFCLEKI